MNYNKKLLFVFGITFLFLLVLPLISAQIVLSPDEIFNGYEVKSISGNETIFFGEAGEGITILNGVITLIPQIPNGITFNSTECTKYYSNGTCDKYKNKKIKFNYPGSLKVKDKNQNVINIISKIANKYTYIIPVGLYKYLKIGEDSIIIEGDTSYNSTDTNVTQEPGFAHLNLSDKDINGYWAFDSNVTAATTYDYLFNGTDGSLEGGVLFNESGIIGGAYSFDGIDGQINFGDAFDTQMTGSPKNWTWSFWMKNNELGRTQELLTKWAAPFDQRSFIFDFSSTNQIRAFLSGTGTTSANYISTGTFSDTEDWHHLAFAWDPGLVVGDRMKIYRDGSQITTPHTSATVSTIIDTTAITFMGAIDGGGSFFNGSLDEFTLYNRTLSSSEITDLFRNQTERFFPTGGMLFQNLDLNSSTGFINITLERCQTFKGSGLNLRINDEPAINFTNCFISAYNVTGVTSPSNSNLTIGYLVGNSSTLFYSPIIIGNITINVNATFIPPTPAPTAVAFIFPNTNLTSPHIKLGEHLIFR